MSSRSAAPDLVDFAEITEIELRVLRRMKEYTLGDHGSVYHGSGVDFVGLREWQAGDRPSSIDWAQSTLTNFTPLMIREYEQPGTAPIVVVADRSPSTRCGTGQVPIAAGVARAIATIGLSAVYFQDMFGLMAFDEGFRHMASVRPRVGRAHVIHCLDAYQGRAPMDEVRGGERLAATIAGHLRRTTLLPVISDFLFEDAGEVIRELVHLHSVHDLFLIMIDSAFAFRVPDVSAGWVDAFDVETGASRLMSRRELRAAERRAASWQDDVERRAHEAGLDVLRLDVDAEKSLPALLEFVVVTEAPETMSAGFRAVVVLAVCLSGPAVPAAFAQGASSAAAPAVIQAAPIDCWWKTDRSAVHVGEPFQLTLTCAVVDTERVKVVVDESGLAPAALHLVPFEVVGGRRFRDIRNSPRRFFQYQYEMRILGEDFFNKDVLLPRLQIAYRVQNAVESGTALAGREAQVLAASSSHPRAVARSSGRR